MKLGRAALAVAVLAPAAVAQLADLQPGRNFTAIINFGAARSEEIDAADVEGDGDLDVGVGNGGDGAPQLSRLFINDGTGTFTDETGTRFAGFPTMNARDIEFFDAENDGDWDVIIANQTPGGASAGGLTRFFLNQGGAQLGSPGFFVESSASWGTLVAVPASQQLCGGCNAGPFRDFSCDCDFNDLDDDGDSDLFFGSYGPGFTGLSDSRVFLNDGLGVFNELWPWANASADTKWRNFDFDFADCDGDFDPDLVTSEWGGQARVFLNNLHGTSLGPELYHDITQHALLDAGAAVVGTVNYEVEFGDADGDGDFDGWMNNYSNNLERLLRNNGSDAGGFAFTPMPAWIKGDPGFEEEDGDFGDYDGDGDLDFFLANFSGTNFLYQSGLAQGLDPNAQGLYHRTGFSAALAPLPELPSNFNSGTSLDGEWFDMDGDGDLDILLANDANQGNWLFRNVLGVPDAHAPSFEAVTEQVDKPNGTPTVIHAAVRDNVPMQLFRFYTATLVYTVDGGGAQSVAMLAQGGQQYRGVIPAQTDAAVEYHVEVTDLTGNTGVSVTHGFTQGNGGAWTDLSSGLAGIAGVPTLIGTGPLTAGSAGALTLGSAKPSAPCALFVSLSSTPAPFKCGTLVPVPVALQLTLATNGGGALPLAWGSWPNGLSGASLYFQYAIADGAAVCGTALSNALRADVP